jgi:hypothetical protein
VIDAVLGDMKALRCQLGASDRQRLDGHMTNLSEIQKVVSVPPATSGKGCATPASPTLTDRSFANARQVIPVQMDLMAAALACDLTRVACLSISHSDFANDAVYGWLGHTAQHHNISHLMGTDPRGKMVQIGQWHAQQVMYLVNKLKAVQEPNGTLWDNTVILWVAECGDGWSHDARRPPFMILGGAGSGYFKTGRYLKYAGGTANSHNRLLQHFLLYMGVPTTGVGAAEYNEGGPLPGITTA